MTDAYLRGLGFTPTVRATRTSQAAFGQAWRYQFDHVAADGAPLFIEHPLGFPVCRLSAIEAPLTQQDIFATIDLHDRPALEAAMRAFYLAHQGMGQALSPAPFSSFRPFRRQQ